MIAWVELVACLGIYVVLTHLAMLSALGTPSVHDIIPVMTNIVWVWHLGVWFPAFPVTYRIWAGFDTKWLGKVSRLVLLKAILQFVTVVPAPSGMRDCKINDVFWLFSCANMMFSGQVALTMVALHGVRFRAAIVCVQSILVVVAGVHYISDCLVAVLAVLYIETLDIKENTLFPNEYTIPRLPRRVKRCFTKWNPAWRPSGPVQKNVYDMVSRTEQQEGSASPTAFGNLPVDEQI